MTDPIAAARAMIEPLTGYTPKPWRQGQNNPDRVSKGGEYIANCNPTHLSHPRTENNARLMAASPDLRDMVATLADALTALQAENQRLREAEKDAVATLTAWFDRRKLAHEAIDQAVIDAAAGYLRTSRVGGMPQSESDLVLGVISDMARLSLFADLFARAAQHSTEASHDCPPDH